MIKAIGTAYKRDDFTNKEFFDYWLDVHGPISAKAPGLRGYVVSEVIRRLQGELETEAFVEQWFDDEAAFQQAGASPEVAAAWEDVPRYAKTTGTFWLVKEHVIIPPPARSSANALRSESKMRRFEGKNVFVTGAGSGFGRRTAERFAEEGAANIYLVDYNQDRLDATAPLIAQRGASPVMIHTDLGSMENCVAAVEQALSVHPRLDVLVSNAAAWVDVPFVDMTLDQWRRVLSVNLDAYYALALRAVNAMKETGGGVILFTSSISSLGHGRGFTAYCVAKAGLVSLAKAIAVECAPYGIRCNCVSPGPADTQQSVDLVGEELMEKWRREGFPAVPMNRLAAVDDIAGAFLYLASDDAKYVSGANLVVDGALTAQVYDVPES
jgi:3-oxoacyl-[acyl-carrier protein] reductase